MGDRVTGGPPLPARVEGEGVEEVISVLSEAFQDYAVIRHVLGSEAWGDRERVRQLVRFFVMARVLRGEPLFGVPGEGGLTGAAIVSFPENRESPTSLGVLREELWRELGNGARARYEGLGELWRTFGVSKPHIHLNMIGVRPSLQGTGVARLILEAVHALSETRPGSRGVTLTTESPANVPFYEHMGYEIVGHARVSPELESWGLFRRNRRR